MSAALFEYLLRQGDNTLVLGHRVSEWCGVSPVLEEDIALANTALDLIGQTQMWLGLAGEVEGKGRTADELAFRRDVWDFRNLLLVEQPNGHFGQTIMRQFLFDAYQVENLTVLQSSTNERIAEIAAKSLKEVSYHVDRSADTVIALGDGTAESHNRMQAALDLLWPFAGEMFLTDLIEDELQSSGIAPDHEALKAKWSQKVGEVFTEANLVAPGSEFSHLGGKTGQRHTEHLGHMLATMQFLPRAYPDATW